jgi:hypothetical protein
MTGYEQFQQIMAELNRKKELEKLRKEGKSDNMFKQFGDLFGEGFNFGGL